MTTSKSKKRWENPESPAAFERECYPPGGIARLLPHHFLWWAQPLLTQPCGCCCCCCGGGEHHPAEHCTIDLQLEANTFGPGRSIHVAVTAAPYQYFAEFYLTWTASGPGQVTVDLELISGPPGVPVPRLLADDRGPSDRYLFGTHQPGRYLFRATATDAQGTCFDTLQVDVPLI